jgi:hypothetical protein
VAVTRWCAGWDLQIGLPELSAALGLTPYDARLRLAGPPPLIVAQRLPVDNAQALLAWLRGRGHGAVACDLALLPAEEQVAVARGFTLQPDALLVIDRSGRTLALPHAQVFGLVRAAEITDELATVETKTKKLALGRAALSGGLLRTKQVTTVETHTSSERQDALYLFRSTAVEPIVFRERELNYDGLGAQRGQTRRQSFTLLCERLRRAAPHAIYDDRLLTYKRRPELAAVDGGSSKRTMTSTNSAANQLAAFLLMHAHLQGQL